MNFINHSYNLHTFLTFFEYNVYKIIHWVYTIIVGVYPHTYLGEWKECVALLDSRKCLQIYEYCQQQYEKLEKKSGHYSPKHDKIVMELAAKEFQMSDEIINRAFDLAAQTLSKNNKTKSEKILRNRLIRT